MDNSKLVARIVTAVWDCVNYDAEGHAWLDNLKAVAKVSALISETQPVVQVLDKTEVFENQGFCADEPNYLHPQTDRCRNWRPSNHWTKR